MTLKERIRAFQDLFKDLSTTNSSIDKGIIIDEFLDTFPLQEDLAYILYCLSGKIKTGFTYNRNDATYYDPCYKPELTVKEYLQPAYHLPNTTYDTLKNYYKEHNVFRVFTSNILNRSLKLGISFEAFKKWRGLERFDFEDVTISPMLAKNINNVNLQSLKYKYGDSITITEKLDGNRCILYYKDGQWIGQSRNGKLIKGLEKIYKDAENTLHKDYIYDGELLPMNYFENRNTFNEGSGLVNSHSNEKDLMYLVFDVVMKDVTYELRRCWLTEHMQPCEHIKLLYSIYKGPVDLDIIMYNLDGIVEMGGEGVMINFNRALYEQKRTDSLLKVKKSNTMDMRVIDYIDGTGKYEGAIGSLVCRAVTPEAIYICNVGTGLSDFDRGVGRDPMEWFENYWLGCIIEVEYFDVSQSKNAQGTIEYSLRFPRLKRKRTDKEDVSVD